jgi:hypothetical protein
MKIKCALMVLAVFLFVPGSVFAQAAKIVDVGGKVTVKMDASSDWKKARVNMVLDKDAEIETKENSFCTLAFDEEQKNIVTLKQNSRIRIDSIKPGAVFLPQGRVFSLIKNLPKNEKFEVRTPTAVAGARGTGWVTQTDGDHVSEKCFDDVIYVQGLDPQGNITGETDLPQGSGMDVQGGQLGSRYALGDDDYKEWNDFTGYLDDLQGGSGEGSGDDGFNEARNDQREDARGEDAQERRQDEGSGYREKR